MQADPSTVTKPAQAGATACKETPPKIGRDLVENKMQHMECLTDTCSKNGMAWFTICTVKAELENCKKTTEIQAGKQKIMQINTKYHQNSSKNCQIHAKKSLNILYLHTVFVARSPPDPNKSFSGTGERSASYISEALSPPICKRDLATIFLYPRPQTEKS